VPDDLIIEETRACRFIICRPGFIKEARRKNKVKSQSCGSAVSGFAATSPSTPLCFAQDRRVGLKFGLIGVNRPFGFAQGRQDG